MQWKRLKESLQTGVLITGALLVFAPFTQADPITGGTTTVNLDSSTVTALTGLGFTIAPVSPATLAGTTAVFPITGGDTTGDITHSGGLGLTNAGTTANITDFVIHLAGPQANTITGLLTAGAASVDGVTFFDIGSGLNLTLAPDLAGQLSGAFGVPDLTGAPIGTATVDPTTGAATPEPASMVLLGAGLVGIAAVARYRRAKA